jgi:hypothetical protein
VRATLLMTQSELDRVDSGSTARGFEGAKGWVRRILELNLGMMLDACQVEVDIHVSDATSNPELDWLFAEADRVQAEMEKLRHVAQPSMDCPECGGSGQVASGSLGSVCVGCDGGGVVDAPFSTPLELPDITDFRRRLSAPDADLKVMRRELTTMTEAASAIAQKVLLAAPAPRVAGRIGGRKRRAYRLTTGGEIDIVSPADDFDDLETSSGGDGGDEE